jgi:hypothetical protein
MGSASERLAFQRGLDRAASFVEKGLRLDPAGLAAEIRKLPEQDDLFGESKLDSEFEHFWAAFPKRAGSNPKKPARAKWEAVIRRRAATFEDLLAGAERYADQVKRARTKPDFVTMCVTWLNQERWRDEDFSVSHAPGRSLFDLTRELGDWA